MITIRTQASNIAYSYDKDLARMDTIGSHRQNYYHYLDELIHECGKSDNEGISLDFLTLDDAEKGLLIALKIKKNDWETDELVSESDKSTQENTFTNALIELLLDDDSVRFAQVIRDRTINYYKDYIQDDINHRCSYLHNNFLEQKGFSE